MNALKVHGKWVAALVTMLVASQVILFGSSLAGKTILAPTDILAVPGFLSNSIDQTSPQPANKMLYDSVFVFLPWLEFTAREMRAGHLPLWNPHMFCGAPFLANNQSALFSPFTLAYVAWPDPHVLAWIQFAKTIVAGVGMCGFLRASGIRWPSAVVGACAYPLCGFMIIWLNYPLSATAVWMPWCFWAVESLVQRPRATGGIFLALALAMLLLAGQLEGASYIMLAAGVYGVVRWLEQHGPRLARREGLAVVAWATAALVLGMSLAAVQLLPTYQYVKSGYRWQLRRELALEQRLPGPGATPELIRVAFPYLLGAMQPGSKLLVPTFLVEGGANAYVGFVALAFFVPLALRRREAYSQNWLWLLMAVCFAAPVLHAPILGWWHAVPPFAGMQPQRALVITGWALLVLAIRGLDSLDNRDSARWIGWISLVAAGLTTMVLIALALAPPDSLVELCTEDAWPWFFAHFMRAGFLAALATIVAGLWLARSVASSVVGAAAGAALLIELLVTAQGFNPQCPPESFYPRWNLTDHLQSTSAGGRVVGLDWVMTPNLAMAYGLRDLRGYDGVDPQPYLELLDAAHPRWYPPQGSISLKIGLTPSPVLDMLGLASIVSANKLDTTWELDRQIDGLFVYRNSRAMARAFAPRRARGSRSVSETLETLGRADFDAQSQSLVYGEMEFPAGDMDARVNIVADEANRVVLEARAVTDALIVLADSWSPGWQVTVDGRRAQPLRVNHALRGVMVPSGEHTIEWRYAPRAVRVGLTISVCAAILLAGLAVIASLNRLRYRAQAVASPQT